MRHAGLNVTLFPFETKKKSLILLSSMHFDAAMDADKPKVISFHNCSVVFIPSTRWLVYDHSAAADFFNLLDLAAINAYTPISIITGAIDSPRGFLLSLARELTWFGQSTRQGPSVSNISLSSPSNKRKKCQLCRLFVKETARDVVASLQQDCLWLMPLTYMSTICKDCGDHI